MSERSEGNPLQRHHLPPHGRRPLLPKPKQNERRPAESEGASRRDLGTSPRQNDSGRAPHPPQRRQPAEQRHIEPGVFVEVRAREGTSLGRQRRSDGSATSPYPGMASLHGRARLASRAREAVGRKSSTKRSAVRGVREGVPLEKSGRQVLPLLLPRAFLLSHREDFGEAHLPNLRGRVHHAHLFHGQDLLGFLSQSLPRSLIHRPGGVPLNPMQR